MIQEDLEIGPAIDPNATIESANVRNSSELSYAKHSQAWYNSKFVKIGLLILEYLPLKVISY